MTDRRRSVRLEEAVANQLREFLAFKDLVRELGLVEYEDETSVVLRLPARRGDGAPTQESIEAASAVIDEDDGGGS